MYKLICCCLAILMVVKETIGAIKSHETLVNFGDPKIRKLLESSVTVAKMCALESHASPDEVRAYFTNSPPRSKAGQCFVACVYEKSKFIKFGEMNPSRMIELATQVNGPNSRVVQKLKEVTGNCMTVQSNIRERCERAATYNNCINANMMDFAFPEDVADWIVTQVPFVWMHLPRVKRASFLSERFDSIFDALKLEIPPTTTLPPTTRRKIIPYKSSAGGNRLYY